MCLDIDIIIDVFRTGGFVFLLSMYQYFCFGYSQVSPPTLQGYFLFIPSHVVQIIGGGGGCLVSILDLLQWDSIQEEYGAISWAPLLGT